MLSSTRVPQPDRAGGVAVVGTRAPASIAPSAAAILALQRGAGNAAVAALLARKSSGAPHDAHPIAIGAAELSFDWTAAWTPAAADGPGGITKGAFGEARTMSLPVPAGAKGTLRVALVAHAKATKGSLIGFATVLRSSVEWTVDVAKDGSVKAGIGRADVIPNAMSFQVKQSSLTSQSQDAAREFTASPTYVSAQQSSSGSIPIVGGYEQGTTEPADVSAPTFLVTLEPRDIAEPTGTVEISDIQRQRALTVHFAHEEQITLAEGDGDELMRWFVGLSAKTQRRLRLRQPTPQIQLDAFTSNTGPSSHNREVADARRSVVMKMLGDHVHPDNWVATTWGEDNDPQNDRKHESPDPERRVVRIRLWDDMTQGAGDEAIPDMLP